MVRKLAEYPDSPDEIIGFHAQQAAEKFLKAVLSHKNIAHRKTHDLTELIDQAKDNGIACPPELEELRSLNPYAVEYFYGDLPPEDEEPLDAVRVTKNLASVETWTVKLLGCD